MRALVLWFGVVMFILGRELLFRLLELFIYMLYSISGFCHLWMEEISIVSLHTSHR